MSSNYASNCLQDFCRDHGIDSIRYPGTWNKLCPNNSSLSIMGHCFFTAIHNEATEQFRLRIHKMATFVLFMGTFLVSEASCASVDINWHMNMSWSSIQYSCCMIFYMQFTYNSTWKFSNNLLFYQTFLYSTWKVAFLWTPITKCASCKSPNWKSIKLWDLLHKAMGSHTRTKTQERPFSMVLTMNMFYNRVLFWSLTYNVMMSTMFASCTGPFFQHTFQAGVRNPHAIS